MDPEQLDIFARNIATKGMTAALGFQLVSLDDGVCVLKISVDERHLNVRRAVHGGVLTALCDTALGMAFVPSVRARGGKVSTATTSLTVEFISRVLADAGELVATGRVLRLGASTGFGEVEVRAGETLVAKGLGTIAVVNFE